MSNKQSSSSSASASSSHYFMDYYKTNGNPCSVESIPEPISIVHSAVSSSKKSTTTMQVWPVMVSCYDLVVDKDNDNENCVQIVQPKVQRRIGRMDLHLITVPDITTSTDHHTSVPLQFNLQKKQQRVQQQQEKYLKNTFEQNNTSNTTIDNNTTENDTTLSTGILDGKWNRIPQPSISSSISISNSICLDDTIHTGRHRNIHNNNNNSCWSFVSAHSDGTICIHALDIDTTDTTSTCIDNTNISHEQEHYIGSMRLLGKSDTIDSLPTINSKNKSYGSSSQTLKQQHDDYYYDNESDTDDDDNDDNDNDNNNNSSPIIPLCLSVAWDTPHLYHKKYENNHHVNDNHGETTVPLSSQNVGAKVDRIVSTYSNGIAAIHDVVYMYNNNNIANSSYNSNSTNNNNSSTDCMSVQIIEYERWLAHYNTIGGGGSSTSIQTPAEVWTACFLHTNSYDTNTNDDASTTTTTTTGTKTIVLTGGDDGYCKVWDIRSIQRPMQKFTSANKLTTTNEDTPAGITCLSPHPYYTSIVAVGSYDETISLYDMRYVSSIRPVPLCTVSASSTGTTSTQLGGGVWRMKWHPYTYHHLLIGAMHGGAFVYNFRKLSSYWDTTNTSTSTRSSDNILNSNKNTNIYNTSTTNTTTMTNDSTVNTTNTTTARSCFYFDEKDAVPVVISPTIITTSNTKESTCFYLEEKDAIPVVTASSNSTNINTKSSNTLSYGFVPRHLQGSNMQHTDTNSKVDQQQSLCYDDDGIIPMSSHHSSGDDEDMYYYNLNNLNNNYNSTTGCTGTGGYINRDSNDDYHTQKQHYESIIVKPKCKKKFSEHESMVYGADWIVCPHPTQNGHLEAAISCSFYDRSVYLWDTIF